MLYRLRVDALDGRWKTFWTPARMALRRLFGGWEPWWVGREGKMCALGPVRLEIDVEAEDVGHKVAGLADDPRIL
jgi:hypothetical protein